MSRGLWFVAGAGAGVYAMVRGRRAAEALSVDGLRDRLGAATLGARMLGAEVAAGKTERERELREEMGRRELRAVDPAGPHTPPDPSEHTDDTDRADRTDRAGQTRHEELTGHAGHREQGD